MFELRRLEAGHAPAVLAFELTNRAYFAVSISDRGDEFFDQFADRFSALLAEQDAGTGAFYVVAATTESATADSGVDRGAEILGRVNLYDITDGAAVLGYRVAQHVARRGVATAAVRELCGLAAERHGLRTVRAATATGNVASQKVLIRSGFVPVGAAEIGGRPGTWYQRQLR